MEKLHLFFYPLEYSFLIVIAENEKESGEMLDNWLTEDKEHNMSTGFYEWPVSMEMNISSDVCSASGNPEFKLSHQIEVKKGVYAFYHSNE